MRAALLILCALLGSGCTCGKKKPSPAAEAPPVVAAEPDASPKDRGREAAEWREVKKPVEPARPADVPPPPTVTVDAGVAKIPDPVDIRSPKDPYYESLEKRSLVTVGTATLLEGNRDAAVVAAKLDDARKSLAVCHQKALDEKPDVAGALTVDVTIDARGVITETSVVRNDVGAVADCVLRRMRGVRFGSGDTAKLRVPFTLAAK